MNGSENSGEMKKSLTSDELRKYKDQLAALAHEAERTGTLNECDSDLWNWVFSPHSSDTGLQIYMSFTDRELLEVIIQADKRYGRTPSKNDVYYVYLHYIKQRFGSFANALIESGFESDGYLSEQTILRMLRSAKTEEAEAFFQILSAKEIKEHEHSPSKDIVKTASKIVRPVFGSHKDLKKAIEVMKATENMKQNTARITNKKECFALLLNLQQIANDVGRTPLRAEVPVTVGTKLWLAYGNWNTVLKQAGLPVLDGTTLKKARYEYMLATAGTRNIPLTYRKMLSDEDIELLDKYCEVARKLGRIPSKREAGLPQEIAERTRNLYGSWNQLVRHLGIPAQIK